VQKPARTPLLEAAPFISATFIIETTTSRRVNKGGGVARRVVQGEPWGISGSLTFYVTSKRYGKKKESGYGGIWTGYEGNARCSGNRQGEGAGSKHDLRKFLRAFASLPKERPEGD